MILKPREVVELTLWPPILFRLAKSGTQPRAPLAERRQNERIQLGIIPPAMEPRNARLFPRQRVLDSDVAMAAQMLAGFGRAGFEALVSLIRTSTSTTLHGMAASALMYTKESEAVDVLTELLADPEPDIRRAAEIAIYVLPKRRKK
jgi:hypothetical protein